MSNMVNRLSHQPCKLRGRVTYFAYACIYFCWKKNTLTKTLATKYSMTIQKIKIILWMSITPQSMHLIPKNITGYAYIICTYSLVHWPNYPFSTFSITSPANIGMQGKRSETQTTLHSSVWDLIHFSRKSC